MLRPLPSRACESGFRWRSFDDARSSCQPVAESAPRPGERLGFYVWTVMVFVVAMVVVVVSWHARGDGGSDGIAGRGSVESSLGGGR